MNSLTRCKHSFCSVNHPALRNLAAARCPSRGQRARRPVSAPTAGRCAVGVRYRDQPVLIYRQVAVVGIHLNAEPGTHKIRVELTADGSHEWRQFSVADKSYTEQHLTIDNPRMVNPLEEDLVRGSAKKAHGCDPSTERFSAQPDSPLPFVQPVAGPVVELFRPSSGAERTAPGPALRPRHRRG